MPDCAALHPLLSVRGKTKYGPRREVIGAVCRPSGRYASRCVSSIAKAASRARLHS